ncbi:MAG: tRNA (guanine(10)-N(2))-dimethyltransferase [Candidatus Micrarchaeota archaeon]|nr:tRNA (guanine(10)-N(2))-dimethyltransferase [Candidatus Micrarchaeota archaeon]
MKLVTEGAAGFYVPDETLRRNSDVFYNPEMAHARNVVISLLSIHRKKVDDDLVVLDPMAASGVRGIRILKEVEGIEKVVFNDINPHAVKYIEKNLKLNKIPKSKYEILNEDCNILFLERRREFDFVDIDPFGSPVNYLPNVWSALKKRAILAVSATDTGALSGTFKTTCQNRYGVLAEKVDFFKEFAVSVLTMNIQKELARHDIAFYPIISHTKHYFRVVGFTERGKERVSQNLSNINFTTYCPSCYQKSVGINEKCQNCGKSARITGPLWTGKLKDSQICDAILKDMIARGFSDTKDVHTCVQEIDEPFYYNIHKICKNLGISAPKLGDFFNKLESEGFAVSRTHLSDLGFKTNAPVRIIEKILKQMKR